LVVEEALISVESSTGEVTNINPDTEEGYLMITSYDWIAKFTAGKKR